VVNFVLFCFFSKSYFKITVKQRHNFLLSSGGATFTIGGAPKIEKKKKNFLPMNLTTFFVVAINDNKINLFLLFFILFSL
jgi:hypothetical protein